jgi:hypothetical protein
MESTNVSEHSITLRKPGIEESRILLTKQEGYDVSDVISQVKRGRPPDVDPSVNEEPEVQATEVILDLINTQTHDVFNVICNKNMEASEVRNNLTDEQSHDVEDFIRRGKQGRLPDVDLNYYFGLWSKPIYSTITRECDNTLKGEGVLWIRKRILKGRIGYTTRTTRGPEG